MSMELNQYPFGSQACSISTATNAIYPLEKPNISGLCEHSIYLGAEMGGGSETIQIQPA